MSNFTQSRGVKAMTLDELRDIEGTEEADEFDDIRQREREREAHDDRELHRRYDNNVHPMIDSFLTAFKGGRENV
jgi:hypothetical protein